MKNISKVNKYNLLKYYIRLGIWKLTDLVNKPFKRLKP